MMRLTPKLLFLLLAAVVSTASTTEGSSISSSSTSGNVSATASNSLSADAAAAAATEEEDDITPVPRPEVASLTTSAGLYWKQLTVRTGNSGAKNKQVLLHPFSGSVQNGHVCAIIGPSGSGKSTLLAALGSGGTMAKVDGSVLLLNDALPQEAFPLETNQVAHLEQHDAFFEMLTVHETMEFAAFLQYPNKSVKQRNAMISKNLDALGLTTLKHRRVGDRIIKKKSSNADNSGLSGGERRRLSVGLELLMSTNQPKVFLADEATTGLDSSQASKICKLMVDLARRSNIPALLTLHQPRASIWRMMDSFILMGPGGRVCYAGLRKDAQAYFDSIGYYCPEETNPAEFYIDLVSIDTEDAQQAAIDEQRIDYLANYFRQSQQEQVMKGLVPQIVDDITPQQVARRATNNNNISFFRPGRLGALLRRSWRQNFRNKSYNMARLAASLGSGALFSMIFKTVRKDIPDARSVADRTALLSFGVINMSMMALSKTIHLFSREKAVVQKEQSRQELYSSLEYLISKIMAEIPLDTIFAAVFTTVLKKQTGLRIGWMKLTAIFSAMTAAGASLGFAVGATTSNGNNSGDMAMAVGLPIMVVFMVVGVINPSGVDKALSPPMIVQLLKLFSPIKWAIEGLLVAEFKGLDLRQDSPNQLPWERIKDLPKVGAFALVENGDQILEALGLEEATFEGALKHLGILSGCNLLISWMGLAFNNAATRMNGGRSSHQQQQPKKKISTEQEEVIATKQSKAIPNTTSSKDMPLKPAMPISLAKAL